MRYNGCIKRFAQKVYAILASRVFFWLTIVFFVLQAAWIAFSALYPQAFDEQFHFGLIQVYSHHWLPFLNSQPPDANPYGAVARDPSFFFHYVMSFPYRVIELFTKDETNQIILLRLINVALFVSGLLLFYKVLRRTGLSRAATNASIFVTTMIPVAPQLAGQINYDNLLIPMTACACLLLFTVIDQLRKHRFTFQALLSLGAVCLLSSIVKYEFLPIMLAIIVFLAVYAWLTLRGKFKAAFRQALTSWRVKNIFNWLLVLVFLISFALFAQRDIGNLLQYHEVAPDCSQVLNLQDCSEYSVWKHDYTSHEQVVSHQVHADPNPIAYLWQWVYWLWFRLFFAINGLNADFENYPPLPLPAAAFGIILVVSVVAVIVRGKKTFAGNPYLASLGVIVLVYLLTLFGAGYQKYLQTGVLELMNGRYLFPILLPGAAVAVPAVIALSKKLPRAVVYGVAVVLMLCLLDGGGVFTFISRSNPKWYWSNSTVRRVNADAKKVVYPLVLDGRTTYGTGEWFFN